MKIQYVKEDIRQQKTGCWVVFAQKNGDLVTGPQQSQSILKPLVESGEFGKSMGGSIYWFETGELASERLLFFNVGEGEPSVALLRKAAAKTVKIIREKQVTSFGLSVEGLSADHAKAVVEGILLANYQFNQLKTDKDKLPTAIESLTIHLGEIEASLLQKVENITKGTYLSRDLMQLPANLLYPETLAQRVQEMAPSAGLEVEILEEDTMQEMGMGALLAVSQGSAKKPKMIIMEYKPESPKGTICFVGKAVTFDSGGLSLKPPTAMIEMKGDMGGGAAVVGIMSILKGINCPYKVIGIVPSVENMPSGTATRPSDVVTSLSGSTVEINNTDAEGRLILADALTYAKKYQPDYVIDFCDTYRSLFGRLGAKSLRRNGEPPGFSG